MRALAPTIRLVLLAYPRRWRDRYGTEMTALLAERQPGWGDLLDLARERTGGDSYTALEISESTVERHWRLARAWLRGELEEHDGS